MSVVSIPAAQQKAIITEAADRYGVRPDLLGGLYGVETSSGKNVATSSAGAEGPFQLEPGTAASLGVKNPEDFKESAFGAAHYLSEFKSRGTAGMLSAYNAGPAGGLQPGYVKSVEQDAKTFGGAPVGVAGNQFALPGAPKSNQVFDQAAFQKAQGLAQLGRLVSKEGGSNPLLTTGVLSTAEPLRSEYTQGKATAPALRTPPTGGAPTNGKLGGFLSASAPLQYKRIDQGQDIQTKPGEALLAPGDGTVVAVKSDPSGFGPDYPVVKFSSGPLSGQSVYLGHTDSSLKAGDTFKEGQTIARTSKTGHNAPPGWAEIGMASALGQGIHNQGAQIAPYLRKR